ncbi:MAG: 3,4-dihydroxyphenylacetate 2,3-dioxygenase, partial [Actinomycetota bacterium]|nr:3,4-dihydroxyphenylacetate 2,3-dioxygenase [Actinomycetota bacterium]
VRERTDPSELEVTIGADGFSYTRPDEEELPTWKQGEYKLGHQC